jgi:hypothetical protein
MLISVLIICLIIQFFFFSASGTLEYFEVLNLNYYQAEGAYLFGKNGTPVESK